MLNFQYLIDVLYRHPRANYNYKKRFGGYLNYRRILNSQKEMLSKSEHLTPVKSHKDGLPIYFLTGKKYLYQTLFCIQSLVKVTDKKFRFILIDDGTFDEEIATKITQLLPHADIITAAVINKNLYKVLPENEFPILHQKRKEYPHIKKLTDIHTIPGTWKLVLDSDMLFWNEPKQMINWLNNPSAPLHMTDCERSYGYSEDLMKKLKGHKIPDLINVGVLGLNSEAINWQDLEHWISVLEKQEGKTYYLEQALSAMLIADLQAEALDNADYKVNPTKDEALNNFGVLHHYVDLSKEWYFKFAWKKLL